MVIAALCAASARLAPSSNMFRPRRASPSAARAIRSSAVSSAVMPRVPSPRSGSWSALRSSAAMSSTVSERRTYTRARESNALTSSNEGFSVVAPTKMSVPSSRNGRKVSCCVLLNRCTSSRNRTVGRPFACRASRARSTAARMSFTPAMTAESARNCASARRAITRASVVFPVPGGPQRINECSCPASIACRSGLPGPRTCC